MPDASSTVSGLRSSVDGLMTGAEFQRRESSDAAMPIRLARLWAYLRSHCRGKANMRLTKLIGRDLGIDAKTIVHLASDLVTEWEKPVGSNCTGELRGIYIAETEAEKAECDRQIDSRIIGLARRKRAFARAPIAQHPSKQERLFADTPFEKGCSRTLPETSAGMSRPPSGEAGASLEES